MRALKLPEEEVLFPPTVHFENEKVRLKEKVFSVVLRGIFRYVAEHFILKLGIENHAVTPVLSAVLGAVDSKVASTKPVIVTLLTR